jgi:hypothetical protein
MACENKLPLRRNSKSFCLLGSPLPSSSSKGGKGAPSYLIIIFFSFVKNIKRKKRKREMEIQIINKPKSGIKKIDLFDKGCEACATKVYCFVRKSTRNLCPCSDCLIKTVCKISCQLFNKFLML